MAAVSGSFGEIVVFLQPLEYPFAQTFKIDPRHYINKGVDYSKDRVLDRSKFAKFPENFAESTRFKVIWVSCRAGTPAIETQSPTVQESEGSDATDTAPSTPCNSNKRQRPTTP